MIVRIITSMACILMPYLQIAQVLDSSSVMAAYHRYTTNCFEDRSLAEKQLDSMQHYLIMKDNTHAKIMRLVVSFHENSYSKAYKKSLEDITSALHLVSTEYDEDSRWINLLMIPFIQQVTAEQFPIIAIASNMPSVVQKLSRTNKLDGLAFAHLLQAVSYSSCIPRNVDSSIVYYENSIRVSERAMNLNLDKQRKYLYRITYILSNLAVIYNGKNDVEKNLEILLKELDLNKKLTKLDSINSKKRIVDLYDELYRFYKTVGDIEFQKKYALLAYNTLLSVSNLENISLASFNQLATTYIESDQLDSARIIIEQFNENIEKLEKEFGLTPNHIVNVGIIKFCEAHIAQKEGDFEKAMSILSEGLEIYETHNLDISLPLVYINAAEIIIEESRQLPKNEKLQLINKPILDNRFPNSLALFEHILSRSLINDQILGLEGLSIAYATKGEYEKAYRYQERYQVLSDSLFRLGRHNQIAAVEVLSERKQQEQKLNVKELELQNMSLVASKRHSQLFMSGLVALIAIAGSIGIWLAYKKRLRLNQELHRLNDQLKNSNQEIRHYAYSMSHDISSPLKTVLANLRLIKDKEIIPDTPYLRFFNNAYQGVNNLSEYVDRMLFYIKMSKTKGVQEHSISLNYLVNDIFHSLNDLTQKKSAKLEVENLPDTFIDVFLMRQLFQNLTQNALKHSLPKRQPYISIQAHKEAEEWIFKVSDNGKGITENLKKKLFQDQANSDDSSNAGLGLKICQQVVEKLDGRIWLESSLGKGTTFFVAMPQKLFVVAD